MTLPALCIVLCVRCKCMQWRADAPVSFHWQFFVTGTISRLKTVNDESESVWRDSFHSELLRHRLAPSHWFTLLRLEAVYGKPATHWQNVSTQHQQEVHKSPIKAPGMKRNFEALRKRSLTTSHQTNTHGCEGWGKKKIRKKKRKTPL